MSKNKKSHHRHKRRFSESRYTWEWLRMAEYEDRKIEENILAVLDSTDDDSVPSFEFVISVIPNLELALETMDAIEEMDGSGEWPKTGDRHSHISQAHPRSTESED